MMALLMLGSILNFLTRVYCSVEMFVAPSAQHTAVSLRLTDPRAFVFRGFASGRRSRQI
jgi:hypothetical protein